MNNYITATEQNKYGHKRLSIPKPEFYVVYTGTDKTNVDVGYSLAEEFFNGDNSFIDVKVRILQADEDTRDIVTQYIMFTKILTEQEKKYGRGQKAILETIHVCIDQDVLKQYLERREQEVITIMMSLYDQEKATKDYGREQKIEGAVEVCRDMNMTDQQILDYLMKKFGLTENVAEKYLEPTYA